MIYLSLGSNKGDRVENLASARRLLSKNGIYAIALSSEITTTAWGIENQPDFLNQVLKVDFTEDFEGEKSPYTLLCICQKVEREIGKVMPGDKRYVKWGERVIDIDILEYDGTVSDDPRLILPHHTMNKDYIKQLIVELGN